MAGKFAEGRTHSYVDNVVAIQHESLSSQSDYPLQLWA